LQISVFILLIYLTGTVQITVSVPGLAYRLAKVALKTNIKCKNQKWRRIV